MSGSKRKTEPKDQSNIDSKRIKVDTQDEKFLSPVKAFIVKAGIQKVRLQIFENQLKKFGGTLESDFNPSISHIVVDDGMDAEKLLRLLKVDRIQDDIVVVKTSWLSACFREKKLVEPDSFTLKMPQKSKEISEKEEKDSIQSMDKDDKGVENKESKTEKHNFPKVGMMFGHHSEMTSARHSDEDSDYCPSDQEDHGPSNQSDDEISSTSKSNVKNLPKGNWVCAQSSKVEVENPNQHITDKLQEMVKTYESTNDKWRAFGYQKAIQVLRRQKKPVSSFEEALALPGVGKRLAEKIWEIAESGQLRKLNEFKANDEIKIIETFMNVWGAGATTARAWYQQGMRSLDDLREKANLTHQQKVGLRLYDDINNRMPREEAGEIEQVVRIAAESVQEDVIAQACGSYRRGKPTCGDIDILITHPDGKSHKGLFGKVLAKLKEDKFLTDDLVTAEDNGNQKKYLGVCKLPGEGRRHRRIDIIVVPYDEYACALVYFTGSAHFNRSLRHLAKKMGMSLSEHSLNKGVVRHPLSYGASKGITVWERVTTVGDKQGTEKIHKGTPIPTPTEESVFTQLGVPYRPPEERDH